MSIWDRKYEEAPGSEPLYTQCGYGNRFTLIELSYTNHGQITITIKRTFRAETKMIFRDYDKAYREYEKIGNEEVAHYKEQWRKV